MSGISQRENRSIGVSVKRPLRQSNLMDHFKKQKSNQNESTTRVEEHRSTETSFGEEGQDHLSEVIIQQKTNYAGNTQYPERVAADATSCKGNSVHRRTDFPGDAHQTVDEDLKKRLLANDVTITPIGLNLKKSLSEASETLSTEINSSPTLFPDYEDSNESFEEVDIHLGASLNDFNRMPECSLPLPPLKASSNHTVLIRFPIVPGEIPRPHPERSRDTWDSQHVRMPSSPENLYPVDDMNGGKKVESRWNLIRRSLQKPMASSLDLEDAIMTYNSRYADKWDFSGLHAFFTEVLDREEAHAFFTLLLPAMVDLTLDLPNICTSPIPLLRRQRSHTITMSQKQVSSLLANGFFCTFPRRNAQRRHSEYSSFPEINFVGLFSGGRNGGIAPNKAEKLKCILHYFRQVTKREPKGTLTFSRQIVEEFPKWDKLTTHFRKLGVSSSGTIEDDGSGMLEVDFANKYMGGGVLHRGCVQEEIRFVICPELLVTRLFTEVLDKNESLIVTGCERFSKYDGYADSFQWIGNYHDKTSRDSWGRRCTRIVAIDAVPFTSKREQYSPQWMIRELNKAFSGFYEPSTPPKHLPAVATGNWGCGAFGGDAQLKSILQLIAAAKAGRDVMYFTFHSPSLCKEIFSMHQFLVEKQFTIGDVWKLLVKFHGSIHPGRKLNTSLFRFIYKSVAAFSSDTEVDSSSPMSLQASPQRDPDDSDLMAQYAPSTSKQTGNTET